MLLEAFIFNIHRSCTPAIRFEEPTSLAVRYCYHIVPPNQSHHFIVQIFAKLHSNPINLNLLFMSFAEGIVLHQTTFARSAFRVFVYLTGDIVHRFVGCFRDVVVHDGDADILFAGEDPAGQKTPVFSAVAGNAVFSRFRFLTIRLRPLSIRISTASSPSMMPVSRKPAL